MPEVRKPAHCRHCAGDCAGDCLLGDGQCIHGWNGRRPAAFTWRLLLDRRWWHRVFWGQHGGGGRSVISAGSRPGRRQARPGQ